MAGNLTSSGVCRCSGGSKRCALCTVFTHFRDGGECVECPDNAWLLVVAFIVGAIACAAGGYILNRKAINLAFLSIGVDYFQVLSMFRRTKVQWPAELVTMYKIFSVFNFNIDISAPECTMPNLVRLFWCPLTD